MGSHDNTMTVVLSLRRGSNQEREAGAHSRAPLFYVSELRFKRARIRLHLNPLPREKGSPVGKEKGRWFQRP